jgi:transcription-repair coupling factor (superfamily II helicase)
VGSAATYFLAHFIRSEQAPLTLIVVPSTKDLEERARELEFYLTAISDRNSSVHQGDVYRFPPLDTLPYFQVSPHRDVQAQRIQTLTALLHNPCPKTVVTSATALASFVLAPDRLMEKRQVLKPGNSCDRDILVSLLIDWGYQHTPLVEDRGTYAVRGGIVDFWGPLDQAPWRVELFGDEIESIRSFDPQKQTSQTKLNEAWLVPVRELLWDDESRKKLASAFVKRADDIGLKATDKRAAAEKIRSGSLFGGIEQLLPILSEEPSRLHEYFPEGTRFFVEDCEEVIHHLEVLSDEIETAYEHSESVERVVLPAEILDKDILSKQKIPAIRIGGLIEDSEDSVHLSTESNEDIRWTIRKKSEAPLQEIAGQIQKWLEDNRIILIASTTAQRRRIKDLFAPYSLPLKDIETLEQALQVSEQALQVSEQAIPILIGDISRGFRWPQERLILITDEEIFGPKVRKRIRGPSSQERFLSFGDLKDGDPLVHEENGIGKYKGMTRLEIEGVGNDFLVLEYAQGDKLYVPVYRMNQIQPYTGTSKEPRLDRLGGASWYKVREKAQKAIRQMAGELLNLYAARAAGKGYNFSSANEIFEAFEASFPYEETEDQERTIEEVLSDMEKDVPMDRLVLGDVGYGKTEVAMRAAFKAVLDGKQKAILVPTTVLAFQHHRTFTDRFKEYPVNIGILSRFQSRNEIKGTLEQVAKGEVDIVVGTHRLLQNDVNFSDLGLLIIDEEHRFGVNQKEKIKQFKKLIDVLALSATPIPRTLNMAFSGLRGISVIETAPTDRLSIRTYVTPDSDATIQEAVQREMRRGGQVFFVHNRVMDIEKTAERLRRILPEVRIGVAHGQMKEKELEEAMIAFANRDFDLLLCTTIIESGIDIPTANTILIERVDQFGLAQIYQLRGRVGRGSHRAYAYLLTSPREAMTEVAKKRLDVLRRFSELGGGFKMACHDLEIRGAGNMLGDKQSGHMEAIGYELYIELLEQAIKELKGETIEETIEPELHLRVPAGIPEDYVRDPALRLDLYRRLANMQSEEDGYRFEEEIVDRFGKLPPETENLLQLMVVKVLAKRLRLRAIHFSREQFIYSFDSSTPISPDIVMKMVHKKPDKYRLTPEMKLVAKQKAENDTERLRIPRYFLKEMLEHVEN